MTTFNAALSLAESEKAKGFIADYYITHEYHIIAIALDNQGGYCGDCRACWNRDVSNVSYVFH